MARSHHYRRRPAESSDLDMTTFGMTDNQEGSVPYMIGPLASKILGSARSSVWHWYPWPSKVLTISGGFNTLTLNNCYPAGQTAGTKGTGFISPIGLAQKHDCDVTWAIVSVSP